MSFLSVDEAIERLNIDEGELKKQVKELKIQVFMAGLDDKGKKKICIRENDLDKIQEAISDSDDDFDLDLGDDSGKKAADADDLDISDIEDDSEEGLFDDDGESLSSEGLNSSKAFDENGADELSFEDDDLDISEDDVSLDIEDDDDDLTINVDDDEEDDATLTTSKDDADDELDFDLDDDEPAQEAKPDDDDDDELDLDDGDLELDDESLSLNEGDETLQLDMADDDDAVTISDNGDNGESQNETLSYDAADDLTLPDDSFSLDDDDALTINDELSRDEDSEASLLLDEAEMEEQSEITSGRHQRAKAPATKIIEEPSVGFLWPFLSILTFCVISFVGVVAYGTVKGSGTKSGLSGSQSFYSDLTDFVKRNFKLPN